MSDELTELRRLLHRNAELSGQEEQTASIIVDRLKATDPDEIVTGLGGHGLAAVYSGEADGPTLLVRADLDALPLPDDDRLPWKSVNTRVAHRCGHDGHMSILVGLAEALGARRPARGRVVCLFQPAEETGAGADRVIRDPAFEPLRPDFAIAQHNLPGRPLGEVVVRPGVFASASRGMIIAFEGSASHAAEPHLGSSMALVCSQLVRTLSALPQTTAALHEAAQVTIVGIDVGGPAFGTNPGRGKIMATLRCHEEDVMDRLVKRAGELARGLASTHDLDCEIEFTDVFPVTVNDESLVERVIEAARAIGAEVHVPEQPFSWSEDFGHFGSVCPSVLFGLGSGTEQPPLHGKNYDFPDELIEPGARLMETIVRAELGGKDN